MSAGEVGRALERLVSVLADTEWTDIPEAVQKRAALVMCDDLAQSSPPGVNPRCLPSMMGSPVVPAPARQQCSMAEGITWIDIRRRLRMGVPATGLNWMKARRVICHAGVYCLPALLAEAEAERTARRMCFAP